MRGIPALRGARSSATVRPSPPAMTRSVFQLIRRTFFREPKLHPIDHQMAKRWIKQRLVVVFPELKDDPRALERAYRALSLDPREGTEEGDLETVFEMKLPKVREDG